MHRINLNKKNISNSFLNLLAIGLIIFSIKVNMAYGVDNNWTQVSKTIAGIQYWDSNSLTNKDKGIIEIKTKYERIDSINSEIIEDNIYTMEINCITNKYKDISVNGKNNLKAKWEDTDGDKLINDVIAESCKFLRTI